MYKINSIDHCGRGITKINDKIAFIENALPEEIVEVKIDNEKKKYIEGKVLKYINKSNNRVTVNCPYYDNCGGCNIMHLSYPDQLKFKQNKINNIVNKYLNNEVKINDIVSSDSNLNYRNKITFQVKENVGFYNTKTYELIGIDNCLLSNNKINDVIKYLNKLDLKYIKKITCRSNLNKIMIIIETNNKNLNIDIIKNKCDSIYFKIDNNYNHIYGDKYLIEELNNYKFLISPDSFFQINKSTCIKLYNKIKDYVGKNKNIIDLYCGTGSIGIFINEGNKVIGIEINENAIRDAKENKKMNKLDNVNFICGDSGKKLKELNFKPDVIIVDPPRSGLNKETINNILKFNCNEIVYVSCDPMTLVRDLNILKKDYNIVEITPFDMFPNTYHVECVSVLHRKTFEK